MAINPSLQTNTKVIALATGAEVDSSYLWAGADKAIQSEMQGKDNGDTIYFKTSNVGSASVDGVTGNALGMNANTVKQSVVPVSIRDSKLALKRNAVDAQITNEGEAVAKAKIGQKLAKAAVEDTIKSDIKSIGNVFVDDGSSVFKTIQKACAYMKSITTGTVYGFMDWNVWGDLTGSGQQAVPCALAEARFGKDLKGSWALIDQLRVSGDIPMVALDTIGDNDIDMYFDEDTGKIMIQGHSADINLAAGDMFTVEGVKAVDTMGEKTAKDFVFQMKDSLTATTAAAVELPVAKFNSEAFADISYLSAQLGGSSAKKSAKAFGATGNYYGLIMRTENAQCFGTLNECGCEGAKYSKSSIDNITVHENVESAIMGTAGSVAGLQSFYRWDMLYASKLVEPRNAVLVLVKA